MVAVFVLGNLFGILGKAPAPRGSPTPVASASASPSPPSLSSSSAGAPPSIAPTGASTAAATPSPVPTPHTYVVQTGDTLNSIAQRFDTTAAAIAAANGIAVTDTLPVGQVLIIP